MQIFLYANDFYNQSYLILINRRSVSNAGKILSKNIIAPQSKQILTIT